MLFFTPIESPYHFCSINHKNVTRNFATFAIFRFSSYINYLSERFLISKVISI